MRLEGTARTMLLVSVVKLCLRTGAGAHPLVGSALARASSGGASHTLARATGAGAAAAAARRAGARMMSSEFSALAGGGGVGIASVAPISNGRGPAQLDPPSQAQLAYARRLAEGAGLQLPPSALESRAGCSAFIEAQAPGGVSAPASRPPTEKQIMLAQRTAAEAAIDIPDGVLERADACARFIEDTRSLMDGSYGAGPGGSMAAMAAMGDGGMGAGMGGMAERPPSAKQVAFAEQLAAEQQLPRPTFQNAAEASAYIELRLAEGGARSPRAADGGGGGLAERPPSAKQVAFAEQLAAAAQLARPTFQTAAEASAFIEARLAEGVTTSPAGELGATAMAADRPPSEKQLAFAANLAQAAAVALPAEIQTSGRAATAFIESLLGGADGGGAARAPSAKQLDYAESLAAAARVPLPAAARTSARACAAFLDARVDKKPSDKQLLFAVQLARDASLGLSAEVVSDKAACSRFIDALIAGQPPPAAQGRYAPAVPVGGSGAYATAAAAAAWSGGGGGGGGGSHAQQQAPDLNDEVDPSTWAMPGRS